MTIMTGVSSSFTAKRAALLAKKGVQIHVQSSTGTALVMARQLCLTMIDDGGETSNYSLAKSQADAGTPGDTRQCCCKQQQQ